MEKSLGNKISPLKECIEFIESHKKEFIKRDTPYIAGEKEEGFNISEDRIFKIDESDDVRNLGFVDGGTSSILRGGDFSINLNRVAGVLFKNNTLASIEKTPEMIEFFSATLLEPLTDGTMAYYTRLFPRESEHQKFLPDDKIILPINEIRELMGFRFMPSVESIAGVAMRFAEWSYAKHFVQNELNKGDIFVRDGSLQTGYKNEILLARDLYIEAKDKNVYITGLSKSCRLITKNGSSLISLIDLIASNKFPDEKWYYHPIYKITKADNLADVFFVKLHEHAYSPFRFDIFIEQSQAIDNQEKNTIISNIALNANDLSFPGYPYGLIKADQLSYISKKEIEPNKIQLITEFDPEIYEKYILPRVRSMDAHDIINKIRK